MVDADLVRTARRGDQEAFAQLFDRWFGRVWSVAYHILRDADLASEVTQDCFLVAWQKLECLRDVEAFGGWILRIGRNRSLNRLDKERRTRAVDGDILVRLGDDGAPSPTAAASGVMPEYAAESRDRQELVWAAAAALGERDWSLLDLHLRHGLAATELAEELGVNANHVHQLLHRLRAKLEVAIGAYLLWCHGRAGCRELDRLVASLPDFNRATVKALAGHQSSCARCDERHRGLVDPEKLLAGVPLLLPRSEVAAQVAAELAAATAAPSSGAGPGSNPVLTGPVDAGAGSTDGSAIGWSSEVAHGRRTRLCCPGRRGAALVGVGLLLTLAGVSVSGASGLDLSADRGIEVTAGDLPTPIESAPTTLGPEPGSPQPLDGGETNSGDTDGSDEAFGPDSPEPAATDSASDIDRGTNDAPDSAAPHSDTVGPEASTPDPVEQEASNPDPDPGSGPDSGGGGPTVPLDVVVDPSVLTTAPEVEQPEPPALTFAVSLDQSGVACNRAGGLEWDIIWSVVGTSDPVSSSLAVGNGTSAPIAGTDTGRATFCALPSTPFIIEATVGAATVSHTGSTPPAQEEPLVLTPNTIGVEG